MSEISYSIITFWVFPDEMLETIKEKCRELEYDYDVEIEYVLSKKSFNIKGTDYENMDKTRNALFKILMAKTEKQTFGVPRYPKKEKFEDEECAPGLPPPDEEIIREHIPLMTKEEDSDEIEIIFRLNSISPSDFSKMFELGHNPYYHWHDIRRDCDVDGYIYEDEMKIVFTRGELENVEIAKRRIKQLQKNILRPELSNKRIPLVHYTSIKSIFKLCFCEPTNHPYFRSVKMSDFGNTYILAPLFSSNPNFQNLSNENRVALSNRIRDYNFTIMKDLFSEGLEYIRVHSGEIRFSGRLGKVIFTNVEETAKKKYWDFTDLKDSVSEPGVKPRFNEITTCDRSMIDGFSETFSQKYIEMVEFYEMIADARYGGTANYSEVYMYVNKSAALRKVVSKWEPVVSLDWTILDRSSDLSICLATRRTIRTDIKPFQPFANHITLDPKQPSWILFKGHSEESPNLIVKTIYFKQAKRYKFGIYIVEVTRVEELSIKDNFTGRSMKVGEPRGNPKVHYTIEIFNEEHKEIFKENLSLGSGEVADWTIDHIIGESPNRLLLFNFVKTMLGLVTTQ